MLENKNEYERNIFQLKTQIDDITEKKQMENDKKVNITWAFLEIKLLIERGK